jgi:hypothetical protein
MFGALLLYFSLMVFVTLLFLLMCIQYIYVWYYPLVVKSDVFFIFQHFQVLVRCQFSCKIKFVQIDWGGEYRKLNSFFQTISIHHRLIYPHMHEQNSSVERRHCHIVETSITFLGQCSAPL